MAIVELEALTFEMRPLVGQGIVECCCTEADHLLVRDLLAAIEQDEVSLVDQQEAGGINLIIKANFFLKDDLRDLYIEKPCQLLVLPTIHTLEKI